MSKIVESLKQLQADTYTLFLMTQNYHWNIKGENFYSLHKLFEEQYEDLFEAIDEVSERIAGLDEEVPGTYEEFANLTDIEIETGALDASKMLNNLKSAHKILINNLDKALDIVGEEGDEDTFDLMVSRLKAHNKMLWMISKSIA